MANFWFGTLGSNRLELGAARLRLLCDGALERDRLRLTQSEGVNHAIKQETRP